MTTGPIFDEINIQVVDADIDNTASVGDTLHYTAVIPNTGDRDATDVLFINPVPENTIYMTDSLESPFGASVYNSDENQIEWRGDIAAGHDVQIIFNVMVKPGAEVEDLLLDQWTIFYDSTGDGIRNAIGQPDEDSLIPARGCSKGDIDANEIIDLRDAIRILKVLSGKYAVICTDADVNDDGKIGIEEMIYVFKKISE